MKDMKKIFLSSLMLAVFLLAGTSCSKEYLETRPESSASPATIFETTDNAVLAINGICKLMTTQYWSVQGLNGEGSIKTWWGNFGNDLQRCNHTGWATVWNHQYNDSANGRYASYPWWYYYKIIGNANQVIANIDNAEGPEAEKQFIKAQALTFRAHAFTMLAEMYIYRWSETNNGAGKGLVLRLDTSTGDMPLSTAGETYAQIYADLDEAISLYTQSGLDRGSDEFYKPNLDVAYAVYARAALNREDWSTVVKYAPLARKNHPLMSQKEYMDGGFSDYTGTTPKEWIWGVYEASDQTLYYYSFFAYQASNASSSMQRTYPLAISKELYDQIPETDVRRKMWLGPTPEEWAECNSAGRSTKTLYNRAKKEYASKLYSTSLIYGYMQFKFLASFMPGGGSFNIYRGAEMVLAEAEARCMMGGQDAQVQALLNELNKNLDASYNCTKTGADLLKEVKLYRRIDLWGEGFDYYDYKRWNEPIVRKSIKDGGSFHTSFAITIKPEDGNRWTYVIPQNETQYNHAL
jgi:hypothetical protein